MKAIKSFSKIVMALILALSLTVLTACDMLDGIFGGGKGDGNVYTVTLNANGGTFTTDLTEYTSGTVTNLPAEGTKEHYTFEGWFISSECTGKAVSKISATATGNKEYWAKWKPDSYAVAFNIDNNKWNNEMTSYSYSTEATPLPTPTKSSSTFNGWYANSALTGDKISAIPAGDWGVKQYYGSWIAGETPDNPDNPDVPQPSENEVTVTAFGGYEEGAYIEFNTESGVNAYKVEYKKDGANNYTELDSELIRINGNTVRADVVGISAGSYSIKVTAGTKTADRDVTVTAYDRSGYAHFGTTAGVGAYNDDGTPKTGAVIVYVNEDTKNTVSANIDRREYSGLAEILSHATSGTPVIVRIIGRIAAPTWAHSGDNQMIEYTKSGSKLTYEEAKTQTKAKFGVELDDKSYSQSDLTALGFELEKGISALNGLTSTMTLGSDTCWNNMSIGGSSSHPTNITVEGIGNDAEIFQWGFTWRYASSIEIRNITFDDYTEDACSFEGGSNQTDVDEFDSKRIWVHNNTFNQGKNYWDASDDQDKHEGDGATDFKRASYITLSFNHYYNNHKTGLIGSDNSSMTANVTFHHNYYDTCQSRLPLSRQANMHMYNNYYHNSTSTSISLRSYAYAFIENCYFDGSNNTMIDIQSYNSNTANSYGVAKIYNCVLNGKGYSYQSMPDSEKPSNNSMHSPFIVVVNDRTTRVANNNQFYQDFDTNSSAFYYDSAANKSKVTRLDETANVPTVVKELAGVHKN